MAFNRVYTIWNYHIQPLSGIADYLGIPHYYHREWDEKTGDYAEAYILTPVDDETFAMAIEQWDIWREWQNAFLRGDDPSSTHPQAEVRQKRYDELADILKRRIALAEEFVRAAAIFHKKPVMQDSISEFEVEWAIIES